MAKQPTYLEQTKRIVAIVACMGLLLLVGGTIYALVTKILNPALLGTVSGMSTGVGLLGLGTILYRTIKIALLQE